MICSHFANVPINVYMETNKQTLNMIAMAAVFSLRRNIWSSQFSWTSIQRNRKADLKPNQINTTIQTIQAL